MRWGTVQLSSEETLSLLDELVDVGDDVAAELRSQSYPSKTDSISLSQIQYLFRFIGKNPLG